MKRFISRISAATAIALFSFSAESAPQDTDFFQIDAIVASTDSTNGYKLYPKNYSLPTSQGCVNSDFAEMNGLTMNSVEAEMIANTVLAAFISGRKIKLRLDGCSAASKRPLYRIATMDYRY